MFFPQAMLGGFSFRAGEHTTSAVREIAGPNQNDYNLKKNVLEKLAEKPDRKVCPKNLPIKPDSQNDAGMMPTSFQNHGKIIPKSS